MGLGGCALLVCFAYVHTLPESMFTQRLRYSHPCTRETSACVSARPIPACTLHSSKGPLVNTHCLGISFSICLGRMTCRYSKLSSESVGQLSSLHLSAGGECAYLPQDFGRSAASTSGERESCWHSNSDTNSAEAVPVSCADEEQGIVVCASRARRPGTLLRGTEASGSFPERRVTHTGPSTRFCLSA